MSKRPNDDSGDYDHNTRKRVNRACDRCRLKKSKVAAFHHIAPFSANLELAV